MHSPRRPFRKTIRNAQIASRKSIRDAHTALYTSCYHKVGRAIARSAHFFRLEARAFEEEQRRHWEESQPSGIPEARHRGPNCAAGPVRACENFGKLNESAPSRRRARSRPALSLCTQGFEVVCQYTSARRRIAIVERPGDDVFLQAALRHGHRRVGRRVRGWREAPRARCAARFGR